jgi:predicted hydrocarbon binding protein
MSIELRKYIKQSTQHPLAPFHIIVRADSAATARALLEQALEDLGIKLAKPKEEAKPAVKVIKNPNHCALVKDLVLTKGKNYYFVRCSEEENGMLIPAGLLQNDVDVKECFECKSFKPKEAKA